MNSMTFAARTGWMCSARVVTLNPFAVQAAATMSKLQRARGSFKRVPIPPVGSSFSAQICKFETLLLNACPSFLSEFRGFAVSLASKTCISASALTLGGIGISVGSLLDEQGTDRDFRGPFRQEDVRDACEKDRHDSQREERKVVAADLESKQGVMARQMEKNSFLSKFSNRDSCLPCTGAHPQRGRA